MAMFLKRCECCGNYFEQDEKDPENIYCSKECMALYQRCVVCGEYYLLNDFFNKDKAICSEECSKTYTINIKEKEID